MKNIFKKIRKIIFPHFVILNQWALIRGDQTLRLNYPLNKDSIVFDVGGYVGEWTEDIYNKYNCNIHNFEIVDEYIKDMKEKFKRNKKIIIHNFGLGNETKEIDVAFDGEGSSVFKKYNRKKTIRAQIKDIKEFVEENNIERIHLIKMNIEGAEYELLDRIIDSDLINKIDNLQIQFHKIYKDYLYWQPFYTIPSIKKRRKAIQKKLEKTHYISYNYSFVWEGWRKK